MRTHLVASFALALTLATVSVGSAVIATRPLGPALTPEDLVSQLLGAGVTVSNVTVRGCPVGMGTFDDAAAAVGLSSGIILSSGDIAAMVGPNKSPDTSTSCGVEGDPDLDKLVPESATQDAAVLEFDFVPTNAQLAINYVFASEEYNEFVGSRFNDVFAFFVNGANAALLPGVQLPLSVNNVNANTNALFYVPNDSRPGTYDVEADGFTVVLTARASVNAGQTNHIKIAIADVSDANYDSSIFMQASGVSSTSADVAVQAKGTTLIVDCNSGATGKGLGTCAATGFAIVPGGSGAVATEASVIKVPTGLTAVTKSVTRKFTKKGRAKLRVKLNSTGKATLRRAGSLDMLVVVEVTDRQGQPTDFQSVIDVVKKSRRDRN